MPQYARKLVYWLGLAAFSAVFFIRLCGFLFQCGCRNWWDGGTLQCNIHQAHLKHCPFCEIPSIEHYALIALIVAVQGRLVWRERWVWAALAFPIVAAIEAVVLGWYRGYWS